MMSTRKLRFAIFGNIYQPKKSVSIQKILACLSQHEAEAYIERNFYTFITEGQQLPLKDVNVFDDDQFEADFAISMGGDGTFLRTASVVGMKQIPILGINTGRLGFLADVNAQEIERTIAALHDEDYAVDTRAVIQVETNGQPLQGYNCALNDVAILKRDNASMIAIRATINGEMLTTYQADGLIVSTPTGSTAYNLSAHGPIVNPETSLILLTPINPHTLNARSIVLDSEDVISVKLIPRNRDTDEKALVSFDGRHRRYLREDEKLIVSKANDVAKMVMLSKENFLDRIRNKMQA